jgi:hypothetical protein
MTGLLPVSKITFVQTDAIHPAWKFAHVLNSRVTKRPLALFTAPSGARQ